VEIALDVGSVLVEAVREVARTVRFALTGSDRTAHLTVIMIIVIIALHLLF
jgi:hypothetical protein